MIFTTKNKEFAIFGKTITDVKEKWKEFKKELAENNGKLFGENGALDSLFSGKKSNNILTPETLKQFEEFKEKFNSSSLSAEALAEQMENVDQRIIDYAKTCKNGEMTTEGFKASIDTMSFSAKAGKVALQALATAGNMLAMWAFTKAIQLAVTAIDNYIHRLDNAKEALSNTQSELSSLNNEIEDTTEQIKELEALDPSSLSITDKEDLQRLKDQNEELRIRQQYLEQQEKYDLRKVADLTKEKYNQKYGNTDNDTIDQYRALYGEKQMQPASFYLRGASAAYNTPYAPAELKGMTRESEALANLIAQYEYYSEAKKNAVQNKNTEEIEKYNGKLEELAQKLRDDRTELQGFSDDLAATGETSPELDDIASKLKLIDELLLSPGQNLVNLINSEGMSETKQRLIDLADAGKLTQDALSANFSEVDEYLKQNGLTLEDLISVVRTYKEELSDIPYTAESFSFPAYEEQINDIQSTISTLRSALDAFNTGTMDESTVLDLMQEFPELTPYIDLAADGFGNLSEGLSVLLAQQPASLIQSLQELKDSLNTDAEREQVDLLINSLQSLSSYGDSGIEAYATTIGSTWNDTANVIEGVTSQFENLAKVQEAVADGLTMSMDAAAELAAMYPEILTNAEYAGNGQITLNEEVVKSILAGDKSIVDAQITKLEADKAMLIAKEEAAQAELNVMQQVGNGQGHISEEVARKQISDIEQRLEAQINALNQENNAFAGTMQDMSNNAEQFDDYAGNVSNDIATNMNTASASMANGMETNSVASQYSLSGIAHKATDVAKAVAGIATGTVINNADAIYKGKGGTNSGGIKTTKSSNGYSATARDFIAGDISFDEFESQLQIDISAYQKAISNIDAQIEILKNLQATFDKTSSSANGGIGGHDYRDKIKDLEKEKDKINSVLDDAKSGSSTKEKKDEYKELFDFFERRIKNLNAALSLLKTNLDNVTGSFAKNKLIDAEIAISEEKFKNYSDALNMYTEKANEALSKLPSDIAEKVKDGAVDLTTFIGDGNKDVVEAIKDYEQWADKVADCKQELAELKTAIRQLELEKFNNIVEEFTNQFDLREDGKDLISKQIALLKEAGELIGESFFNKQIEQSKKQLELLEAEKAKLVEQMESALASGRVQKGTDEWLSMVNTLSDVEGNILDCKTAIEEFDNELLQLHWDVFDRIQGQFKDLDSELSNLRELFKDSKVTDGDSNWSKEGIAQLGLLAQQYELAQYQVQQYNDELNQLSSDYLAGRYSATEYADRLSELSSAQWDAVNASESIKDAIVELNKVRIDEEISAIEKEIDAYKELIDSQIEALKSSKDLHDYQERIAEKSKAITDLERQIAAMRNDTTAATVAKRKQLEEQLAEAKKELEKEQYEHSITEQENALNKEYENYENERNAEIEKLKASLEEREALIAASFETVKQNADIVGQEIALIAAQHGITISDAIISSWKNGETAIAGYGAVLSESTSAFIGNLMGVENEVYNLQARANETANSLAWMFATRADNLVNELASSYYAEENLNYMTKALNDSLIKTLESGYNISSLTNAIGSIIDGVNGIASAARSATQALAEMGAAQQNVNNNSGSVSGNKTTIKKGSGSKDILGGSASGDFHKNTLMRFAGGGVVKKDKDDPLNTIAESIGEDRMVGVKEGEVIFTPEQAELLKEMILADGGKIGENGELYASRKSDKPTGSGGGLSIEELKRASALLDIGMSYPAQMVKQPEMVSNNVNNRNINVHYDSVVTVNGDVNDTKHFLNDMKTVANDAIKKSWHDFEMTRKYGIY